MYEQFTGRKTGEGLARVRGIVRGFTELYLWWHKIYTFSSCVPLNLEYLIQAIHVCVAIIVRNAFTPLENGALNKL